MKEIIPTDPNKGSGLWQAWGKDKKGRDVVLGTYFPSGLLKEIISGEYRLNEIKILAYIARRSFGFGQDITAWLGLNDFSEATGVAHSHLSRAMSKLIKKGRVFKNNRNGNKHMYSINMFRYGIPMFNYRISNGLDGIGSGEDRYRNANYLFGNSKEMEKFVILYCNKGYGKKRKFYIKEDIKTDIQSNNTNVKADGPTPKSRPQDNHETTKSVNNIREFIERMGKLVSRGEYHSVEKTIEHYIEKERLEDGYPDAVLLAFQYEFVDSPKGINFYLLKFMKENYGLMEGDKNFARYKYFLKNGRFP
ncbi:MAG: replication protein [Candidatus Omnitrophota bacterium]